MLVIKIRLFMETKLRILKNFNINTEVSCEQKKI